MTRAVWMIVGREWRRGWGGALTIGLLIAAAGGVTMAATAGARRADSAIDRFQAATNETQVEVEGSFFGDLDQLSATLARLPASAELANRLAAVDGVDGLTMFDFMGATPDPTGDFFNAILAAQLGRAPTHLLVEGRQPDPNEPDEVVVNETAAEVWGGVGSVLTLHTLAPDQFTVMAEMASGAPAGPMIDVRVVGVTRDIESITDLPEPILVASPAFAEQYRDDVLVVPGNAMIAADPAVAERLVAPLSEVAGADFSVHLQEEDFGGRIDEAVGVEVAAMWAFALAAGAAGLVIVYQAMGRRSLHVAGERSTRRALGFTRRMEVLGSVGRAMPAIVLGIAGSVTVALALSGLFPRGIARRAEPNPGPLADRWVLAGGALAILLAGTAIAAASGWSARRQMSDRPMRRGAGLERVVGVIDPAASFGVRLAFASSRRAQATRAGVVAVAIAVGGALAVTAVTRSADRLTSTPRLYGAGWDAVRDLGPDERSDELIERLVADPDVAGIGELDRLAEAVLTAQGPGGSTEVEPEAFVARHGSVAPTLLEGRLPGGPGEVAIGDTVAERLGAGIGDTVAVAGHRGDVSLVVVGRVLHAGTNEVGDGFAVTSDALEALTAGCPEKSSDPRCTIVASGLGVAFRHGVDVDAAVARLQTIDGGFVATPVPSVVHNLRQIGAAPWYLAAFLAVLGVSGLANALATGSRLGRHDLAVARALGLRPRRAAATVCWQAVIVTVAGALLGVLLGLVGGRVVWGRVARGTGALVETVVPPWMWAATPCVALLVALALAAVPAARIAGLRLAETLRTE
jgi:ABC-type lipoprotein release transport system permease subunit